MITMLQVEKLLETFTKKPKSPPRRKLQRSPKIIGYPRECSDEMSLELNEPLLSYEDISDNNRDDDDDDHKKNMKGVCNKNNNNSSSDNSNSNSNVRVKVLLTKEEAARLLAKCKEEGDLNFQDVVMQLGKLPAQRIDVVGITRVTNSARDLELATIIEEDEEEENE